MITNGKLNSIIERYNQTLYNILNQSTFIINNHRRRNLCNLHKNLKSFDCEMRKSFEKIDCNNYDTTGISTFHQLSLYSCVVCLRDEK